MDRNFHAGNMFSACTVPACTGQIDLFYFAQDVVFVCPERFNQHVVDNQLQPQSCLLGPGLVE
jgi:hypothetical protein